VIPRLHPRIALLAVLLLLPACQQLNPTDTGKPQAVTPQITDNTLRERARAQLAQGVTQYQAGDYDNAVKSLQSSLEHGLLAKNEQSRARKLLAFIHCVSNHEQQCRDEFRKAFEIDPEFALTPAEDGHPIWGPVYRSVRTQLIAEREAAAASSQPFLPLAKAERMMSDGLVKYDAGEFTEARELLEGALKEGLKQKSDRVKAMKFVAFTLCLQNHWSKCRAEFIGIYDVDPDFDLTPAEAGHPSWTKTFASAKAHAKHALAAKEAKEAKERAAQPAAAPKSR